MELGRILGLDIGSKRTGVAVSDSYRMIATPLTTVEARKKGEWVTKVIEIIEKEEATAVLAGMPLNQYGEEGKDAQNIRTYIALLRERVSIPVIEWDERFTTVQAERALLSADMSRGKRKDVIDKVAAAIILQSYLDSLRYSASENSNL